MNKKRLIESLWLLYGISVLLWVCYSGKKATEIDITNEEVQMFEYQNSEWNRKTPALQDVVIHRPENSEVYPFCIYGNVVYYAITYSDFLTDPTGEHPIAFKPQYNTQIRCLDITSGKDQLLYCYQEDRCVSIENIKCNGTQLIWEEYLPDRAWCIKLLLLNDKAAKPEEVAAYNGTGMFSIALTISRDGFYWYNETDESNHPISLFYYEFATKKTTVMKNGLTLKSPYEYVNLVNDTLTTYREESDGSTVISFYNIKTKEETVLHTSSRVSSPICNGTICIWVAGYDIYDRDELFIYDISQKTFEKIAAGNIFSYGIVDDLVIVNDSEHGISCYDIKNKNYSLLIEIPKNDIGYGFTFLGSDNNVYAQNFDVKESLKLIHIQGGSANK